MGSLVPLGPRTKFAPRTQRIAPAAHRQLDLALDTASLHGMTSAEHQIAIRVLARLLLEAKGIKTQEDGDHDA
jgi:hypothetical protein